MLTIYKHFNIYCSAARYKPSFMILVAKEVLRAETGYKERGQLYVSVISIAGTIKYENICTWLAISVYYFIGVF